MSIRYKLFGAIARLDVRRPWLVLITALALAILCVSYTRARLEFRTGQDDLINANNRDSRNYLRYTKEFPDLDGLIVAVAAHPSMAQAEQFADTLAQRLNADHANVKSVFYRIDPHMMGERGMLYLSTGELSALAARIHDNLPMLRAYAGDPTPAAIFRLVNQQIDNAASAQAAGAARRDAGSPGLGAAMNFDFVDSTLAGMLAEGNGGAAAQSSASAASATSPDSPWSGLAPMGERDAVLRDGYLTSDNGKYLLLNIAPGAGAANGPDPVEAIQAELDATRARFPGIEAGMTGGPALAHAEETATAHDMTTASVIAIASNVLLIVIPFRGIVAPFFAIIALLTGVAWSFGFTTAAVGHLNLLSAVFTSVLAGIGINFPIHLMARYEEARRRGATMPAAVELAVVNTGTGVFASACIMALAFLMPMFTDFKGIAELGLVSAAGLFMCLVSAMLVFPALIALRDRNRPPMQPPRLSIVPSRTFLERLFARPKLIVAVSAVVTLGLLFLIRGVRFDQNLLKLQAGNAEAVRFENTLLRDSGRSSWFAVSIAPTRAVAEAKAAAYRRLSDVSDVETIATYLPGDQAEKLALLAAMRDSLAPIRFRHNASANDPAALT